MNAMLRDMLVGPLQLIGRTALVGVLAYVSLVLMLRLSGKRTLSKLNAFDSSSPTLVFYAGEPLPDALREERLTEDALRSAIRTAGVIDARSVAAVVLEPDGTLSVLRGDGSVGAPLGWDAKAGIASCG